MEPQQQVKNVPTALSSVWRLNLVLLSPQSKLTYPFVHKFKQVIGTNREVFKIVLELLFLQHVPGLRNRCKFALAKGLYGIFITATELDLNRFWTSTFRG